jgi:hypothetical protein
MKTQYPKTVIYSLAFLLGCKGTNPKVAGTVPTKTYDLSHVIAQSRFIEGSGFHRLSFEIRHGNAFEMNASSEGWNWNSQGSYRIEAGTLILKAMNCLDNLNTPSCKDSFEEGTCILAQYDTTLQYSHFLKCTSTKDIKAFGQKSKTELEWPLLVSRLPAGMRRTYRGRYVITMGNITGVSTTAVMLRDGPGVEFKAQEFIVNAYDGPRFPSLRPNTNVEIHARTIKKHTVAGVDNYWYLISVADTRQVWVFAEYIKP